MLTQYVVYNMQCPADKEKSQRRRRNNDSVKVVASRAHVYCSICGTSFNSDKQSEQHYRGKLHAKKLRLARYLTRVGFSNSDTN